MKKIVEIITEPTQVYTGEVFKIKIKAIRYVSYGEMKEMSVNELKDYKVLKLKGEDDE